MKTRRSGVLLLMTASALLTGACATSESGSPGDSGSSMSGTVSSGAPSAPTEGVGAAASGAQEDTLQACMARIPQDASAGQRIIAQQSCERDEANRKAILVVPGAR